MLHAVFLIVACSDPLVAMPRGAKISSEMQGVILRLSKLLKNDQIAICVGVSERAIRRTIAHFREHGTIEGSEPVPEESKGNRHLRDVDVEVHPLLCFLQKLNLSLLV